MLRLCLVWCLSGLCAHLAAALPLNTEDKVVPQARSHPCWKSNTTCGHPALSASSRNGHAPLDPSSSYGNLPLDHSNNFLNFLKKVHRRYPPGSQIFQERYQIFLTRIKLVRNSKYTFKAHTGYCTYFPGSDFGVSIKGYEEYDFSGYEEEMMKMLIDLGPLAVIVDAVSWQDYLGGIIQHHCSSGEANHAVLVIGFDKTGDTPYWIVKNSWGTSWGIEGYVYIKMGGNVCGIAETVSAPFV
ncbi:hypothetical protein FKM82_001214 [Ascaphus truei]